MRRLPLVLLASFFALGCPRKEESPPKAPAKPLEVKPEPTLPLPESPPSAAAVPPRPDAEVELVGKWSSKVKAARHAAVAQVEPCLPVPASPKRFGEVTLPPEAHDSLFAEFFIPQGTTAHLCVYAFDDQGAVIGAVTIPETPKRFEGLGELMVGPHTVEVAPLPKSP